MTPIELQDNLAEELRSLFSDKRFRNMTGEYVGINVYTQHIPINETDDEDDPVPYIIVRLNTGDDNGDRDSNNTIGLIIIIGLWDDALNAQGHRDVLHIIQRIYDRFQRNPNLKNKAAYTGEFHWALQEDNYYPFFFGACSMKFNIAALRREDPYA